MKAAVAQRCNIKITRWRTNKNASRPSARNSTVSARQCARVYLQVLEITTVTAKPKRKLSLIVLVIPLLLLVIAGIAVFVASVTLSGKATLPNGVPVAVSADVRGFSVATDDESTTIESAGRVVRFDERTIYVDGAVTAEFA